MKQSGIKSIDASRKNVNGVPVWLLELTPSKEVAAVPRVYLAYMATLVDTNAIVLTYGPPAKDAATGRDVWSEIKNAILNSPPNAEWQNATLQAAVRHAPHITAVTSLPPPTQRVRECIEAVKRAAANLGYAVDVTRANDGMVRVDSRGVGLVVRFVDFGSEVIVASSAHASGDKADQMEGVQRVFYEELHRTLRPPYPIIATDDMVENMVLLKE